MKTLLLILEYILSLVSFMASTGILGIDESLIQLLLLLVQLINYCYDNGPIPQTDPS